MKTPHEVRLASSEPAARGEAAAAPQASAHESLDLHDLSLIRLCLSLTPEQRLERLAAAHVFRAVLRAARPFELRER